MSAYVVNQNHISAIVRWACRNNVVVHFGNPTRSLRAGQEQEMAEILLAENVRSVNYRYAENEPPPAISYNPSAPAMSAIEVIKACQCLEYQSCEHPGWEESPACEILLAIQREAIKHLPGYSEARWHVTANEVRA